MIYTGTTKHKMGNPNINPILSRLKNWGLKYPMQR